MVNIAWKTIKGYGPYAYLQHSVKQPDGTVVSKHIAYLGKIGSQGLVPNHHITVSNDDAEGFAGRRVLVPYVPEALKDELKPSASVAVLSIEDQVKAGVPVKELVLPGKKTGLSAQATGELGATKDGPSPAKSSLPGKDAGELGATGGPGNAAASPEPGPKGGSTPSSTGKLGAASGGQKAGEAGADPPQDADEETDDSADLLAKLKEAAATKSMAKPKPKKTGKPASSKGKPKTPGELGATGTSGAPAQGSGASDVEAELGATVAASTPAPETPAEMAQPQPPEFKVTTVPKDAQGEPLVSAADIKILEEQAAGGDSVQLHIVAEALVTLAESPAEKAALIEVYGELKDQLYAHEMEKYEAGEKLTPAGQPAPGETPPAEDEVAPTFKVTTVPKDAEGKPLVSAANIKKLEKEAATGNNAQLHMVAVGLVDMAKSPAEKAAVVEAYVELKAQHYAHEKEKAAAETAQQASTPEATPTFKVTEVPKDAKGKPLVSAANIKKLEKAAATGDITHLHVMAVGLSDMTKPQAKKKAIAIVFGELQAQLYAHEKEKYEAGEKLTPAGQPAPTDQAETPEVTPTFKVKTVPKDAQGKPLITKANIKKLEEAAASGDPYHLMNTIDQVAATTKGQAKALAVKKAGDELLEQLQAHKNAEQGKLAGLLAQLQAKKEQEKPAWTKLESAKGSTKGGIYENQEGEKFYLKCPPTPKHVQNELLARDLYKLAGLTVLDGEATELDGETCLASRWNDELKGSGTNPKDLKGTREGFAADAWLANWDSVGVGSSKYDNILDLDGEAVRVDTGGALLYRGTGSEKGAAFGLEVTELDGLRDPKLNPVAATVYGDMTLDEIKASAEKVLEIDADDIVKAVHHRFPGDPEASNLATQMLVRRNNISAWLSKEVTQAQIAEEKDVPVEEVKEESAAPAPEPLSANPKVGAVPKDNKGKALVSMANVKKLEKAAATGNIDTLSEVAETINAKLLSPAKKAAVLNACAELKAQLQGTPVMEGDGGSGLSETMDKVESGEVELPGQSVPKAKVVAQQAQALKQGKKSYDADLEQVSGKKGSNEGGLFKDKKLETLHYIKWPNSPVRAKVEVLTALLYGYAQVPVPLVRTIEFKDQDAVMSDWIDETATMTEAQMKGHKDVREGFAVDAWLANWDVVGLAGDNIVAGPGEKAYRVDLGGAILFRAQGKPKEFSQDVGELESLRDPGVNPKAATVFAGMTLGELRAAAAKVAAVTDMQIDDAVDSVGLPKTSTDYPASQFGESANDLPKMLKTRLKDRRDFIVEEMLMSAEEQEKTAMEFQMATDLKDASVEHLTAVLPKYSKSAPNSAIKWDDARQVMVNELGKTKGASANTQTRAHYGGWKGSSISPKGQVLRWAAGEMHGEGRRELRRLLKFNEFLVKRGAMAKSSAESNREQLEAETTKKTAQNLVSGLRVTNKQNEIGHSLHNPGKNTITLYRGWKADQLEYLKAKNLKVGDTWELEDPPLYSWSTSPTVAKSFSAHHGSKITRAQVPLDTIVLSDLVNSTGAYEQETEVIFKGVPKLKTEVTHTF